MTREDLAALAEGFAPVIAEAIARRIAPLRAELDALRGDITRLSLRLDELSTNPLQYVGPHQLGKTYTRGQFVSCAGSLWHANETTTARPGDGPGWTMAVKRGRDAPQP